CPKPLVHNPPILTLSAVGAVLLLLAAYVVIAKMVGWWFCPVVTGLVAAIVILLGAMQLKANGQINDKSFLALMRIFTKALPNLPFPVPPSYARQHASTLLSTKRRIRDHSGARCHWPAMVN